MTNPFEDLDGSFVALINDQGQYSLWPTAVEQPPGWTVAHPGPTRQACLNHVERHWTDLRPRSLTTGHQPPPPHR